jgi:dihydropyrimidinase
MHIDFVLPEKGDIEKGLASYRKMAALGCMDYAFHVAVTDWNRKVAIDMARAVDQGINSFKFFLAYKVRASLPVHNGLRLLGLYQ